MVFAHPNIHSAESNRVQMSPEGIVIHMRIPADVAYVANAMLTLREICEHLECCAQACFRALLVLDEAVRNAIEHAYLDDSGWVDLQFTVEGSELEIVVEDYGCGIDSETQYGSIADEDVLCERGRGMLLILGIPDQATVVGKPDGGTRLTMLFDSESVGDR